LASAGFPQRAAERFVMHFSAIFYLSRFTFLPQPNRTVILLALCATVLGLVSAGGRTVSERKKHVIGATAKLTEVSSRIPFSARVDTGAESCSLHVEEIEIKDESAAPLDNIGRSIRFLIKNEAGESDWIETTIAGVVRVRSSALKEGEYDRRYKVRLTLEWGGVRKEVLVTLNDRTDMNYPLLVGRNFLRHDFLVDVDLDRRE
jgi:hypothetical protein